MTDLWTLFPFTTVSRGALTPGAISPPLRECTTCTTRPCASDPNASVGEVKTCRFGVDYTRLDDQRIVISLSVAKQAKTSSRAKAIHRNNPQARTTVDAVSSAVSAARSLGPGVIEDIEATRRIALEEAKADPMLAEVLRRETRKDVEDELARSHDFQQFAKLILQYAEALMSERLPNSPAHEAAAELPAEGAIYFASRLMISKVDALIFVDDPLRARDKPVVFPLHGLFRQYTLLYQWSSRQKKINLGVDGEVYRNCLYNKRAIGAVIHAVLDNLVKYAPVRSKAVMKIDEVGDKVTLSFASLGPKIETNEKETIFEIGVRGEHARSSTSDGQGIGLASANAISETLGLKLRFEQQESEDAQFPGYFETVFRFDLDLVPEAH